MFARPKTRPYLTTMSNDLPPPRYAVVARKIESRHVKETHRFLADRETRRLRHLVGRGGKEYISIVYTRITTTTILSFFFERHTCVRQLRFHPRIPWPRTETERMQNEWERGRREEDGRLSLSLSLSRITSYDADVTSFFDGSRTRLEISSLGDFDYPETRDKSWFEMVAVREAIDYSSSLEEGIGRRKWYTIAYWKASRG